MAFEYGPLVARDHVPQADSAIVIARHQRRALRIKLNALDLPGLVAGGAGVERIQRLADRHIPQPDCAVGTTGSQHRRIGVFFSSRRRHTISLCDWSSDVCSSD